MPRTPRFRTPRPRRRNPGPNPGPSLHPTSLHPTSPHPSRDPNQVGGPLGAERRTGFAFTIQPDITRSRRATVVMSNHSEFENAVTKTRLIPGRKPADPSHIELNTEAVGRYFQGLRGMRPGRADQAP